jgi:hypothetical protein
MNKCGNTCNHVFHMCSACFRQVFAYVFRIVHNVHIFRMLSTCVCTCVYDHGSHVSFVPHAARICLLILTFPYVCFRMCSTILNSGNQWLINNVETMYKTCLKIAKNCNHVFRMFVACVFALFSACFPHVSQFSNVPCVFKHVMTHVFTCFRMCHMLFIFRIRLRICLRMCYALFLHFKMSNIICCVP